MDVDGRVFLSHKFHGHFPCCSNIKAHYLIGKVSGGTCLFSTNATRTGCSSLTFSQGGNKGRPIVCKEESVLPTDPVTGLTDFLRKWKLQ